MGKAVFAMAVAVLLIAPVAQAGPYRAPRTASGQPDLQGVWTNLSLTALERPKDFQALIVPPAEAAAYDRRHSGTPPPVPGDPVGSVETEWYDGASLARIGGAARSSWVVDPPDGRLPYSEVGRRSFDAARARAGTADNPEVRATNEQCLLGSAGVSGPPMLNARYNPNYQFVQTAGTVALLVEMNHDVRIIRLGDRRHLPADVRPWMGDSVGWWEGDTLVVETTNFPPRESLRGLGGSAHFMSEAAKVTERFTRVSPTQILYAFTVDDPAVFTRPWKGEMALNAGKGPIYEYACHEGDRSLAGILAGARVAEGNLRSATAAEARSAPVAGAH
ncbi:MAG: hypothetical protein ACJ798_00885 [Phenylobacterium sp.]